MRLSRDKGLYIITDCRQPDPRALIEKTEKILDAGITILQYRDKSDDQQLRLETARTLAGMCHRSGTIFLINDDVRLAMESGADGAHLGKDDMPITEARSLLGDSAIIGISCYNDIKAAQLAQAQGADYVAFGSFYRTQTKTGTVRAWPALLTKAQGELSIPVVAIGGITPANGSELLEAGADLLAVINSVYHADDPAEVVLKFNTLFQ